MLKYAILGAIFSPLFCYLAWGGGNSMFVYQVFYTIFFEKTNTLNTLAHPVVALPLIGQILLLWSFFQKEPHKKWIFTGLILIGLLVVLISVGGIMGRNWTIIVSTLPYWTMAAWCFFLLKKDRNKRF